MQIYIHASRLNTLYYSSNFTGIIKSNGLRLLGRVVYRADEKSLKMLGHKISSKEYTWETDD